jgi:hypothetical protein
VYVDIGHSSHGPPIAPRVGTPSRKVLAGVRSSGTAATTISGPEGASMVSLPAVAEANFVEAIFVGANFVGAI